MEGKRLVESEARDREKRERRGAGERTMMNDKKRTKTTDERKVKGKWSAV